MRMVNRLTRSTRVASDDEVSFPVARFAASERGWRPLGEWSHVLDLVGLGDAAALRLTSTAARSRLALLGAEATGEKRLIDRFRAGAHGRIVGKSSGQVSGYLLR
jgi:hypothetical protein